MAAITLCRVPACPRASRIVAPHDCYGGTYRLFNAWHQRGELRGGLRRLRRRGGRCAQALAKPAALLWIETPSNPLLRITDIAATRDAGPGAAARSSSSTTRSCRPAWQQPLALGADLVVHSTTKYLNGHSDVVGGAVVARDEGAARAARLVGQLPRHHRCAVRQLPDAARLAHAARAPGSAWRATPMALAAVAAASSRSVQQVYYPGLPTHPGT